MLFAAWRRGQEKVLSIEKYNCAVVGRIDYKRPCPLPKVRIHYSKKGRIIKPADGKLAAEYSDEI